VDLRAGVAEEVSSRVERRLAAIVAADVVGYSRLMGADEEGTLAELKRYRRDLIDPTIAAHNGRIVKTTGDGMLILFASVVDAVQCAVQIQQGMAELNADVPMERRIEFRAGINVGDIIIDGDDIFGDGVNVAARLESLADPGGICVSRKVQEEVRDKLDIAFEDAGERELKNIVRPIRVFRIQVGTSGDHKVAVPNPAAHDERLSVVVLPFANFSSDPEQEFFADGIVEDLTTDLSRIAGSFVIARNTAFTYKGKAIDAS
jgi:adenylate cyclase